MHRVIGCEAISTSRTRKQLKIGRFDSSKEPEILLALGGDQVAAELLALPPHGNGHALGVLDAVLHDSSASAAHSVPSDPHHQQSPAY